MKNKLMKNQHLPSRSNQFRRSGTTGFLLAMALAAPLHAQVTATWQVASGNWSTALNWDILQDPNGLGFAAVFNNGGALTMNVSRTVYGYSQTAGLFSNSGYSLVVGAGGGSLAGAGIMNLAGGYLYNSGADRTFTILNGTLRGTGQIGYTALNVFNAPAGIIDANTPGTLTLNGSGLFTNQGVFRASQGGTLTINGPTEVNNQGGTIRAENGSQVNISGTSLYGGTLDNANSSGAILLAGGTLREVTIAAGSMVTESASGKLNGTLTNLGTLTQLSTHSLLLVSDTTLTGGGTVALDHGSIYNSGLPNTLTNTNNTLRGSGVIGYSAMSLLNASGGTVQADVSGQTLLLNGTGVFTNHGLMRAMNGGTLLLQGSQEVENLAVLRAENTSTVRIENRLHGGTLDNTGSSGAIQLAGGTLRAVTIAAGSTVTESANGKLDGTLTNLGTLTPLSTHSILLVADTTLTGGGTVALGYGYIYNSGAANTLTNTDNTLRGYGEIGWSAMSLINAAGGTVQADVSGQTLFLNGTGAFINHGLMRAMNGGTLRLTGSQEVENHAVLRAENTSTVRIDNRLHSGTLDNTGSTGTIQLAGGTLRDVTIATGSTVTSSFGGKLDGNLTNLGTLTPLNTHTILLVADTALTGGGTVALGYGYIYNSGAANTLTNTDNTLRGYGEIGYSAMSLLNAAGGTVQADVSGQTLFLNGTGAFTNHGLMRAMNGGTLRLTGTQEVENHSVLRAENDSTVRIENRLHSGTLDNSGSTGTIQLAGGTLRDVTIAAGSTVTSIFGGKLAGSLTNLGTLTPPSTHTIFLVADTALTGGGTVALGYGYIYNSGAANTLTNTNNTLRGYGEIGYSAMSLLNAAGGTVQADVSGHTLALNGAGTITNQGRFRAVNGGVLTQPTAGAFTNFSAGVLTGGSYEVGAGSAFRFNAANIVTNAASIILDGVGSAITNTSNINALANFATNQSGASFTLKNNRDLALTAAFTNNGVLSLGKDCEFTVSNSFTSGPGAELSTTIAAAPVPGVAQLTATNSLVVAGLLVVNFEVSGFTPAAGMSWQLAKGSTRAGNFSTVHIRNLPFNLVGSVTYAADSVDLTLTPRNGLTLADWQAAYDFASPADAELGADPDGDGMTNLFEFANGTNPLVADSNSPLAAHFVMTDVLANRYGALRYGVPVGNQRRIGITYTPQGSSALNSWSGSSLVLHSIETSGPHGVDVVTMRNVAPVATTPAQFFRLQVTYTPPS
ncbi:MAG: hypothetical protein NTW21_40520 [Verrucomicrobia bacterium]|nr:hypothetical protein [Verrucomicrobiota bacterium]